MQRNEEVIQTKTKGKTVLYTRAEPDGKEEEAVVSRVIEVDDDRGKVLNPNKDGVFEGKPANSLHAFMPAPCASEERIM
jgi:hypothetical protein